MMGVTRVRVMMMMAGVRVMSERDKSETDVGEMRESETDVGQMRDECGTDGGELKGSPLLTLIPIRIHIFSGQIECVRACVRPCVRSMGSKGAHS